MKKFEDILVACIEDIKAGRSSIEDCLERYPSLRERLEPLLRIALDIGEPPEVKPSPDFKVMARVRLMEQIHDRQAVTKWPSFRHNTQTRPGSQRRFSMVRMVAVIALALFILAGGTAYASQGSLPGDALYPVKLGTEQMGMMLPGDDVTRAERGLGFANRRIKEIEALAEEERPKDLDLAVPKYNHALHTALARIDEAGDRGLDTEAITASVAEATVEHMKALANVHDKASPEAQGAIARALEVSLTGHAAALQALEKAGVDLSQLPAIPEEVRGRLEEILGGITIPTPGPPEDVPPGQP